ncbi:MAG: prepilin-type N-terminal cleavage/methylation domain-containing protein [Phycisphaerales bacterium JB040]
MRARPIQRGMSLIELILVIVIITLLIALTLPALGGVRGAAQDAVSLARMREHAATTGLYANDWDDYFPYAVDPGATKSVLRGGGFVLPIDYFEFTEFWQFGLSDEYYGGDPLGEIFAHPAARRKGVFISYRLTASFMASPEYWVNERDRDVALWRGVRVSEAAFPSDKAGIVEFNPLHKPPIPVGVGELGPEVRSAGFAFVDGHASRHDGPDLSTPCLSGDGNVPQAMRGIGVFGMHTVDGVHGRDLK